MKTKEERFRELIVDLYTGDYSVKISIDGFPNRIEILDSKERWLIYYRDYFGCTFIRHSLIWSIFEKEYDMNYNEVRQFMKDMLLMYLKIKSKKSDHIFNRE